MSNFPTNIHLMTLSIRTEFLKYYHLLVQYYHLVEQYKRAVNPIVHSSLLKSEVPRRRILSKTKFCDEVVLLFFSTNFWLLLMADVGHFKCSVDCSKTVVSDRVPKVMVTDVGMTSA